MICMKCGRETKSDDVFCAECLDDMRAHPVKVDARIHIPIRNTKKRLDSPAQPPVDHSAQIIRSLQHRIRFLYAIVLCLTLTLAAVLGFAGWYYMNDDTPAIGQNYSTVDDTTAP